MFPIAIIDTEIGNTRFPACAASEARNGLALADGAVAAVTLRYSPRFLLPPVMPARAAGIHVLGRAANEDVDGRDEARP
jgi:hypothetical protein